MARERLVVDDGDLWGSWLCPGKKLWVPEKLFLKRGQPKGDAVLEMGDAVPGEIEFQPNQDSKSPGNGPAIPRGH